MLRQFVFYSGKDCIGLNFFPCFYYFPFVVLFTHREQGVKMSIFVTFLWSCGHYFFVSRDRFLDFTLWTKSRFLVMTVSGVLAEDLIGG